MRAVRFVDPSGDVKLGRLDGELMMESGNLRANAVTGSMRVATRSKDIHLDNVTGDVKVENSNGSVELHAGKLPLGSMQIDNSKGDIQVVLPTEATFSLSARTRDGDIESDFNQIQVNSDHGQSTASGKVGSGASRLEINNQYGSIEIRKGGATEASNQD